MHCVHIRVQIYHPFRFRSHFKHFAFNESRLKISLSISPINATAHRSQYDVERN